MVLESLAATTTTPSLNKGVIVRGFGEGVQFSQKKNREREGVQALTDCEMGSSFG